MFIPLQPGFGKTPKLEWVRTYRDLAGFYSQVVRELRLDPVDVIGYSAGGFIAAEMVAADPKIFSKMILVAPMGIKPADGEIMDIFPITMRTHLRATVADPAGTPEFLKLYGGEMTPEQFEAFEDARAESARIGWEPYMHNPALPFLAARDEDADAAGVGDARSGGAARMYRRVQEGDTGGAGRDDRRRGASA